MNFKLKLGLGKCFRVTNCQQLNKAYLINVLTVKRIASLIQLKLRNQPMLTDFFGSKSKNNGTQSLTGQTPRR